MKKKLSAADEERLAWLIMFSCIPLAKYFRMLSESALIADILQGLSSLSKILIEIIKLIVFCIIAVIGILILAHWELIKKSWF